MQLENFLKNDLTEYIRDFKYIMPDGEGIVLLNEKGDFLTGITDFRYIQDLKPTIPSTIIISGLLRNFSDSFSLGKLNNIFIKQSKRYCLIAPFTLNNLIVTWASKCANRAVLFLYTMGVIKKLRETPIKFNIEDNKLIFENFKKILNIKREFKPEFFLSKENSLELEKIMHQLDDADPGITGILVNSPHGFLICTATPDEFDILKYTNLVPFIINLAGPEIENLFVRYDYGDIFISNFKNIILTQVTNKITPIWSIIQDAYKYGNKFENYLENHIKIECLKPNILGKSISESVTGFFSENKTIQKFELEIQKKLISGPLFEAKKIEESEYTNKKNEMVIKENKIKIENAPNLSVLIIELTKKIEALNFAIINLSKNKDQVSGYALDKINQNGVVLEAKRDSLTIIVKAGCEKQDNCNALLHNLREIVLSAEKKLKIIAELNMFIEKPDNLKKYLGRIFKSGWSIEKKDQWAKIIQEILEDWKTFQPNKWAKIGKTIYRIIKTLLDVSAMALSPGVFLLYEWIKSNIKI